MIKAKKSLGQNFLKDEDVLRRIIESAQISKEDVVIEIGPGHGALTELLAMAAKRVIAIELDDRLIDELHTKFVGDKHVQIVHDDIMKINLSELLEKEGISNYKIVANIPYYITAPIIRLFLETKYPPAEMYLMVQKEVAERIVAQPGQMSVLAVSVQFYADAEYLFTVDKKSFDPVPKIDSAILKIVISHQPACPVGRSSVINKEEKKKFFRIVKAGFSAKRKTLANNLSSSLQVDKKEIEEKLLQIGFSANTRAQELSVQNWLELDHLIK